jgi:hypothetical protein
MAIGVKRGWWVNVGTRRWARPLSIVVVGVAALGHAPPGSGTSFVASARAAEPAQVFELNISVAPGLTPSQVVLGGTGILTIGERSRVRAPISNLGVGSTELGVEAWTGDVYSEPKLTLKNRSAITGAAIVGGTIQKANTATILGGASTGVSFANPAGKTFLVAWPSTTAADLLVEAGQSATLEAGVPYGKVALKSGATLVVTPGEHFVGWLEVQQGASVVLQDGDERIALYVRDTVSWRGTLSTLSGESPDWLLGYIGTTKINFEVPFEGFLLAPNAPVVLGPSKGRHAGQFFAKSLEVRPDTIIDYRRSEFFDETPASPILPDATIDACGESSLVLTGEVDDEGVTRYQLIENTTPEEGCPLVELCSSDEPDAPRVDLDSLNERLNDAATPTEACDTEGGIASYQCPVDPSTVDRSTTCNADTDCANYLNGDVCSEYCVDTLCTETARGCASRYDCSGLDDDPRGCDTEVVYHCTADEDWGKTEADEVTSDLPPQDDIDAQIPEEDQGSYDDYLSLAAADFCVLPALTGGEAQNGDPHADAMPTGDETVQEANDREAPINLGSDSWGLFANPRLFHKVALAQKGLDHFTIDLAAEGSLVAGARIFGESKTALEIKGGAKVTHCGVDTEGKFQFFGETMAGLPTVVTTSTTCNSLSGQLAEKTYLLREAAIFTRQFKALYETGDETAVCNEFINRFDLATKDPGFDCSVYGAEQLTNVVIERYEAIVDDYAELRAAYREAAVGANSASDASDTFELGESFSLVGVHAPIPIGPLSLVVDAQLYGSWFVKGGIEYELSMGELSGGEVVGEPRARAGAVITPGLALETSLYVGIGIDLGVAGASVGLEGVLKLLEVDAPIRVGMSIGQESIEESVLDPGRDYQNSDFAGEDVPGVPNGKIYRWTGDWDFGAGFGLASMSGDLNAAARVHFLFFSKTFRKKIAHWEGFPKEYFPVASVGGAVDVGADGLLAESSTFADAISFGEFGEAAAYTGIERVGAGEAADYQLSTSSHVSCSAVR